jgi:isopenicillin-N epimerase
MDSIDWASARDQMVLDPAVAFLNTGSFGPPSRRAFDRLERMRRHLAADPMDFLLRWVPSKLWEARVRLAEYLGSKASRLVLTTNVTQAVNLVASSLRFEPSGEILLTDQEYVTMRWCWERAAQRQGLEVRTFPLPAMPSAPAEIVEAATEAMTRRTRLFFFSHVVSSIGMVLPARELCDEARRRGIVTVIDGAHGPAFIDLDLANIPCDYYAGSGHKWLLAPTGTGFLHIGERNEHVLDPLHVSWGYHAAEGIGRPDERDAFGSTPRLRRLECEGTRDISPWLAVPEAIDFLATFGNAATRARMRELADYTRRRLAGCRGLTPATPNHPALRGGITAFTVPDATDLMKLQSELWERFRIEVGVTARPEASMMRVSTHFFNSESEVDRLADGVAEVLHG